MAGKISEYSNELLTFSGNDRLDVSEIVSVSPDVWATRYVKWSTLLSQVQAGLTFVNLSTDNLTQDAENRTYNINSQELYFNNGEVGIGLAAALNSRLTVKGSGSTSSTKSLHIKNSSDTDILNVRDDGNILYSESGTFTSGRIYLEKNTASSRDGVKLKLYGETSAGGSSISIASIGMDAEVYNGRMTLSSEDSTVIHDLRANPSMLIKSQIGNKIRIGNNWPYSTGEYSDDSASFHSESGSGLCGQITGYSNSAGIASPRWVISSDGSSNSYLSLRNGSGTEKIQLNTNNVSFFNSGFAFIVGASSATGSEVFKSKGASLFENASAVKQIETNATGIGLYAATPVAQHSSTGEATGFTAGVGTPVMDVSTFTGNTGTKAYTISDIVKALKNIGIIAAS